MPLCMEDMTHAGIRHAVSRCPLVIVPVACLEPFGDHAPIGSAVRVCNALARELSRRMQILTAPCLPYSNAVPYRSFPGCAGVRHKHCATVLTDLLLCWAGQGVETAVILDGSVYNDRALERVAAYLHRRLPDLAVVRFSWQRMRAIREYIGSLAGYDQPERQEAALLSMRAWLSGTEVDVPVMPPHSRHTCSEEEYRTWRKRGMDPEKYRRLYPHGMADDRLQGISADLGKRIFEHITDVLQVEIEKMIKR